MTHKCVYCGLVADGKTQLMLCKGTTHGSHKFKASPSYHDKPFVIPKELLDEPYNFKATFKPDLKGKNPFLQDPQIEEEEVKVGHYDTGPGWPQSHQAILDLTDFDRTNFIDKCDEEASPTECLACWAYMYDQYKVCPHDMEEEVEEWAEANKEILEQHQARLPVATYVEFRKQLKEFIPWAQLSVDDVTGQITILTRLKQDPGGTVSRIS